MDSSTSFSSDLPTWMIGDLQPAVTDVLGWLQVHVPRLNPTNRFALYKRLIDESLGAPITCWLEPTHQDAFRSIIQMYYVTRALPADVPTPLETLQRMVGGAPGQDTTPPGTPWNLQFELFSHALLRLSGFANVVAVEPDLLIPTGKESIAFPVKRVVSRQPKRTRRRLNEAVKQAHRHGHRALTLLAFDPPPPGAVAPSAFAALAGELRSEVAAIGATSLGYLLISLSVEPGVVFTQELSAEELSHAAMLEGHAQVALHINAVPEDEHQALFAWLAARGRQLMAGLTKEHAALRDRWTGP